MADKKNLCAQIDIALHNRVTEEKDRLEMTTSQYIASLLTEYYKMKDENGGINMTGSRTMAFQIPEELFQRIKRHLERETLRSGKKRLIIPRENEKDMDEIPAEVKEHVTVLPVSTVDEVFALALR